MFQFPWPWAKRHTPLSLHLPAVAGSNFTLLIAYAIIWAGPLIFTPLLDTTSGQRVKVSFIFWAEIVFGLLLFGNEPTSWFGIPFPLNIL